MSAVVHSGHDLHVHVYVATLESRLLAVHCTGSHGILFLVSGAEAA